MLSETALTIINCLIRRFTRCGQPFTVESLNIAKNAIEKQIPTRVTRIWGNRTKVFLGFGCPKCYKVAKKHRSYCDNCGQLLDWKDVEKGGEHIG